MFSRKDKLLRKTGPDGIGRYDYLRLLKKEFNETTNEDSKCQILANLANFAYDPINYDYIRSLKIIDLFLELLKSDNEIFMRFSIAGLCNLSSDPTNQNIIIQKNGINLISKVLFTDNQEAILNAVATLIFLKSDVSKGDIFSLSIINRISDLQKHSDGRISKTATIFLDDNQENQFGK